MSSLSWDDQAVVLGWQAHGETGAVVHVLTAERGRVVGFVGLGKAEQHNQYPHKLTRALLQVGQIVRVTWSARTEDQLGRFQFETAETALSIASLLHDAGKLQAVRSACSLCQDLLPERHPYPQIYQGLVSLIELMAQEGTFCHPSEDSDAVTWGCAYVLWESYMLEALGFGLQLNKCASTGETDPAQLTFVSPRTGRAVSTEAAAPYQDKLLPLPPFLLMLRHGTAESRNESLNPDILAVQQGLLMTGELLRRHVYQWRVKQGELPNLPLARQQLSGFFRAALMRAEQREILAPAMEALAA